MPTAEPRDFETELHTAVAACYADPLAFVLTMYPWPMKGEDGPDVWQRELLEEIGAQVRARKFNGRDPVLPIRIAVASGHGIGKSTLIAWLTNWIMSTRRDCHGTLTANTNDQLEKRTWAAVREWTARCLTGHWFTINSEIMYRTGHRETWFCAPASCAEGNSEAFAGQQAKGSTSFYINDEDSAVGDKIHEVEEGGLVVGEPMQFLFGNPTRNTGAFHAATFGSRRDRYTVRTIDSRTCKFSSKAVIAEWLADYGEDSDFFRVRVRGLPPNADELQYIDAGRIAQAQRNPVQPVHGDPLIAGVDVSGGGKAWTVCRFRRGFDARTRPPIRLTGEQTVADDRQLVIAKLAEALSQEAPDQKIAAMFIDSAFGAVIVSRLRAMGYTQVHEINFGGAARDPHDANTRAFMWRALKEWLPTGAIPFDDVRLATDLGAPGFHLNKKNQLVLEAKESMQKRHVASPDDGDALALTWALPVAIPRKVPAPRPTLGGADAWMG